MKGKREKEGNPQHRREIAGIYEKTIIGEKSPSERKIRTELNVLSTNNIYNNSSYQSLNVGHMPTTFLGTFSGFCQVILIKTV